MSAIRRLIGIIIIIVSLIAVIIAFFGLRYGHGVIDGLAVGFSDVTDLSSETFVVIEDSLSLIKDTVAVVSDNLVTVEQSALDVAKTLTETKPLLEQVSTIVSATVPDSMEQIEDAAPNLIQIAGAISINIS